MIARPQTVGLSAKTPEGSLVPGGHLYISSCYHIPKATWKIGVRSPLGLHQFSLPLRPTNGPHLESTILIDGQQFSVVGAPPVDDRIVAKKCQIGQIDFHLPPAPLDSKLIRNFLSAAAPQCQMTLEEGEWFCRLPYTSLGAAQKRIRDLRKTMIFRWSRRPYPLTRRLTLTAQLAKLVSDWPRSTDDRVQNFCRLLSFSLDEEVPLIMGKGVWRREVCQRQKRPQPQTLLIGLDLALRELEILAKTYGKSSRLGYLTVRIPKSQNVPKDLWVSLKPVISLLEDPFGNGISSWHPLLHTKEFGLSQSYIVLWSLAHRTDQWFEALAAPYEMDNVEAERYLVANYIDSNIRSELEFPITNGRTKILKLPQGQYRYELKKHDAPTVSQASPSLSVGIIPWDKKRPRPLISKF